MDQAQSHKWKFVRKGGFDQVIIESQDDMKFLSTLSRKLWATLSCPIDGVHFDKRTLALIDEDNDGKIRISEVLSCVKYLENRLTSLEPIIPQLKILKLSLINTDTEEGAIVLSAAKQILLALHKPESESITLDDLLEAKILFESTSLNGDGMITKESVEEPSLREHFEHILSCCEKTQDIGGEDGLNAEILEEFEQRLRSKQELVKSFYLYNNGHFCDTTAAISALAVFDHLVVKLENFFIRDALIGYDKNAQIALLPQSEFYREFVNSDGECLQNRLLDLSISLPDGSGMLGLDSGINPMFKSQMKLFKESWILPMFGEITHIDKEQLEQVKERADGYSGIFAEIDKLSLAQIDEPLMVDITNSDSILKLQKIIDEDCKFSAVAVAIDDVEKLLRLCDNFYTLLNN